MGLFINPPLQQLLSVLTIINATRVLIFKFSEQAACQLIRSDCPWRLRDGQPKQCPNECPCSFLEPGGFERGAQSDQR